MFENESIEKSTTLNNNIPYVDVFEEQLKKH